MLKNNQIFSSSDAGALEAQWIETNHTDLLNSGTCTPDSQLWSQVTLSSWEPINCSQVFYIYGYLITID